MYVIFVLFFKDWNTEHFFDSLFKDWPKNRVIYINHPYSLSGPFLLKTLMELLKGCNIIMIIPCISVQNPSFDDWAGRLTRRRIEGAVAFRGWLTEN